MLITTKETLFSNKVKAQKGAIIYDSHLQVIHKHYFSGIRSFSRYFAKYGEKYAKTMKKFPLFSGDMLLYLLFYRLTAPHY
jgi:hypothetical protein